MRVGNGNGTELDTTRLLAELNDHLPSIVSLTFDGISVSSEVFHQFLASHPELVQVFVMSASTGEPACTFASIPIDGTFLPNIHKYHGSNADVVALFQDGSRHLQHVALTEFKDDDDELEKLLDLCKRPVEKPVLSLDVYKKGLTLGMVERIAVVMPYLRKLNLHDSMSYSINTVRAEGIATFAKFRDLEVLIGLNNAFQSFPYTGNGMREDLPGYDIPELEEGSMLAHMPPFHLAKTIDRFCEAMPKLRVVYFAGVGPLMMLERDEEGKFERWSVDWSYQDPDCPFETENWSVEDGDEEGNVEGNEEGNEEGG